MNTLFGDLDEKTIPQGNHPLSPTSFVVLLLTGVLALIVGLVQLAALSSVPLLLPLGVLMGAVYLALALTRHPSALVLFMIAFVEFWGFVPESTQVGPLKIIDIVCGLALIPLVINLVRNGFPFHGGNGRSLYAASLLLLALVLGQVLLTTFATDQSVWQSIKAGKPYLFYLGFLLVPTYAGTPRSVRHFLGWLTLIASILSIAYVLVSVAGKTAILPGLVAGDTTFIGLGTFTRVRSMGAPLIVAMLLYQFYRFADGRASGLEKLALCVLAVGAMVHFYRSIWAGILSGILIQAGIEGKRGARNIAKFALVVAVLLVVIGFVHPEYGAMIMSRALSTVSEVQDVTGSYAVRHEEIARWMPIIRDNWISGIGFLHHDSDVGQQMEALYSLEGTGNYDVGWVDLIGRLGVGGVLLLFLCIYGFSKPVWSGVAYRCDAETALIKRALTAFLVAGVVSLPGYAVLSWTGGILPIALFAGMLGVLEQSSDSSGEKATRAHSQPDQAPALELGAP